MIQRAAVEAVCRSVARAIQAEEERDALAAKLKKMEAVVGAALEIEHCGQCRVRVAALSTLDGE